VSRKIEVQILGDSKSLEAALGKAQQKTSRFGSALAAGAKVGAAGLLGLGVAAKIGFDEFTESQKVAAQTAAAIKSTGGAANVTADHINALSQQLLQLSGVDDETIASSENLLLTFRNIHNEAGRTNDVFDQAEKATLDLSVAMGKDLQSSTILVGKALNDPIKGMTALRRVGVSLSDSQQNLIKDLVKSGNTMEAQKIILGELNQEFGGSAEAAGKTLPAQLSKLREAFADVAAQLVSVLLPSVLQLIGVLTTATAWMKRNQTATKILVGAIAALSAGLIAAKVAYSIANSGLVTFIKSERVATVASRILSGALWLVNAALDANPVVLITAGIIALGIALVIAYKKSETFRNVVNAAFSAVKSAVGALVGVWKAEFNAAVSVMQTLYGWVQNVLGAIRSLANAISSLPSLPSLPSSIGGIHIPGLSGGLLGNVAGVTTAAQTGGTFRGAGGRTLQVNLHLDKKLVYAAMVDVDKGVIRQNGRSLLGGSRA